MVLHNLFYECKNIPPIIANPAFPVIEYKNILLSKSAANCGRARQRK